MIWQYEKQYAEAGMKEEEIREARRFFDREKKRLKYENEMIRKNNISYSLMSELEENDIRKVFNIQDVTVNVEDQAITSVFIQKLGKSMEILSLKEKSLIVRHYYEDVSLRKIAKEEGVALSTVQNWFEGIYRKLRKDMGVTINEKH